MLKINFFSRVDFGHSKIWGQSLIDLLNNIGNFYNKYKPTANQLKSFSRDSKLQKAHSKKNSSIVFTQT